MEENLHILLVEDNPAEAFLLQESIAQIHHPPESSMRRDWIRRWSI